MSYHDRKKANFAFPSRLHTFESRSRKKRRRKKNSVESSVRQEEAGWRTITQISEVISQGKRERESFMGGKRKEKLKPNKTNNKKAYGSEDIASDYLISSGI